jgi:UDP-4-amino-4,6-dideoxy-N-acetyl-beta-L-altrosamine transaminase
MIPYGRQNINQDDINAVIEVLKSDYLTQGPAIPRFESAVAALTDSKYAVAVNSATSGLHLGCLAIGLKPGDWLWTAPNTFVATSNAALYCGANVDFVDIDSKTYNIDVSALADKLKAAAEKGLLPKAVVPVHFSGQSCDMLAIRSLADQFGFHIIEDASHAIGGSYLETPIGSCRFSDLTVFSFHPVKIITTGEGGMVTTNDEAIFKALSQLRTHGITRKAEEFSRLSDGPWYYEQQSLGWNYRLTDLQAALGHSQLQRVHEFVKRRKELASRYDFLLRDLPVTLPYQSSDSSSSWHLYVIRLNGKTNPSIRRRVFDHMREAGVGVNVHYIPVHLQPYYQRLGFKKGDFPEAEQYYSEAISLPIFFDMTEKEQDYVVEILKEAVFSI